MTSSEFQQAVHDGQAVGLDKQAIYQNLRGKGYQIQGDPEPLPPAPQQGFLSSAADRLMQVPGNIMNAVNSRVQNMGESVNGLLHGQQDLHQTGMQILGQGAGAINDTIGEGIAAGANIAWKGAQTLAPNATHAVEQKGIALLQSPLGQQFLSAVQGGQHAYASFKQQFPAQSRDLEALVNLGMVMPGEKAAEVGVQAAGDAAEAVAKIPAAALEAAQKKLVMTNAKWANVSKDAIGLAMQHPDEMQGLVNTMLDESQNAYHGVAQKMADKIMQNHSVAQDSYKQAADAFKAGGGTYDVSQPVGKMYAQLKNEFNVGMKVDSVGKDISVTVKPGPANKFTPREINSLQELVNTLANAKNFTPADLLDLDQTFNKAYDAVPLSETKTAKPYHAMIMQLKEDFSGIMRDTTDAAGVVRPGLLPKDLQNASQSLGEAKDLIHQHSQLWQGEGANRRISDNAESYLKSVMHQNKGVRTDRFAALEGKLGINPVRDVKMIHAAKELAKMQATSAGRQGDVIRSVIVPAITGTIGSVGGPMGNAAGIAVGMGINGELSSPFKAGQRAINLGKKLAKKAK